MKCDEFERVLPEYLEGDHSADRLAHVNSCSACAGLVADLNFVSAEARQLQDAGDPSPAVWNALEIQLRREGLIREAPLQLAAPARWSLAEFFRARRGVWLVPVAAALLLVAGLKLLRPVGAGDTLAVARVTAP